MAENKDIVMKCRHMEKVYPGTKALDDVDFDVYRGKGIDEGKKSVAFSLELRADDKTLSDEDIAPVLSKVLGALEEQLHAVLR